METLAAMANADGWDPAQCSASDQDSLSMELSILKILFHVTIMISFCRHYGQSSRAMRRQLSRNLKISKEYVYTYLDSLERAELLSGFFSSETGYRLVRKPSKIYMENTNLLRGVAGQLGRKDQVGTARETFFAHQLKSTGANVRIPSRGDFLVEGKYLFEIGGRTKGKSQVKDADNGFVVRDEIEVGFGNVIPLWLFGFLY